MCRRPLRPPFSITGPTSPARDGSLSLSPGCVTTRARRRVRLSLPSQVYGLHTRDIRSYLPRRATRTDQRETLTPQRTKRPTPPVSLGPMPDPAHTSLCCPCPPWTACQH